MPINLQAVLLRQELPQLSHLAIRARQLHVPFAACTDPGFAVNSLDPLAGKHVRVLVEGDGLHVE